MKSANRFVMRTLLLLLFVVQPAPSSATYVCQTGRIPKDTASTSLNLPSKEGLSCTLRWCLRCLLYKRLQRCKVGFMNSTSYSEYITLSCRYRVTITITITTITIATIIITITAITIITTIIMTTITITTSTATAATITTITGCAAECDRRPECNAFDFTTTPADNACRLVKGDGLPREGGGNKNRQYCKGAYVCMHVYMYMYVCMYALMYA